MFKIKMLMIVALLGTCFIGENTANAQGATFFWCSCWTSGNSRAMGARCFARAKVPSSIFGAFTNWFWLPTYCRWWCDEARDKEKIDVYNFPYTDGTSWDSCSGDAIYNQQKFIEDNGGFGERVEAFMKEHPELARSAKSPSSKAPPAKAPPAH